MSGQAHVRSVDDIARFRAALLTFISGARAAVEECSVEAGRQQSWLEQDRRRFWEAELTRRQRRLDEAKEAAFTDALASQRGPGGWHQMQVRRARQAVDEATAKLEQVRKWSRAFQNTSLPLIKQVERLQTVLTVDMVKAVSVLDRTLVALEGYSGKFVSTATAAGVPAANVEGIAAPADAEAAGADVASSTCVASAVPAVGAVPRAEAPVTSAGASAERANACQGGALAQDARVGAVGPGDGVAAAPAIAGDMNVGAADNAAGAFDAGAEASDGRADAMADAAVGAADAAGPSDGLAEGVRKAARAACDGGGRGPDR